MMFALRSKKQIVYSCSFVLVYSFGFDFFFNANIEEYIYIVKKFKYIINNLT